jgi:hypothetical protein
VLEYTSHANELVVSHGHMTDLILTRSRVAPQFIGRHTESAQTGPAYNARLHDTVLAAKGMALQWDAEILKQLVGLQLLDSLETGRRGGFGRPWSAPGEAPSMKRTPALPIDAGEQALWHSTLVGAGLMSRETSIRERRPDWDDEQVNEELERIAGEQPTAAVPLFNPPPREPTSPPRGSEVEGQQPPAA